MLGRDRRGGSSPVVVATSDGPHLLKLRGAAQGTASLVAEVVVGALADDLGLAVPARRVVTLTATTPTDDRNDELADLLAASHGENLGFRYLPHARHFVADDLARVTADFAAHVRWLDWLVRNPDRTPQNPNILLDETGFWLIDHGAALPFQHDWSAVTEATPLRAEATRPHVFDGVADRLAEWDPLLSAELTRERLATAVDAVPPSFLEPLLSVPATADALARRRAAYVAMLWKRLRGARPF
ncbi:MAG: HipA family kinase [Candidatus Binatia bacterium]